MRQMLQQTDEPGAAHLHEQVLQQNGEQAAAADANLLFVEKSWDSRAFGSVRLGAAW